MSYKRELGKLVLAERAFAMADVRFTIYHDRHMFRLWRRREREGEDKEYPAAWRRNPDRLVPDQG